MRAALDATHALGIASVTYAALPHLARSERVCAGIFHILFVSMCGNSPVAWAACLAFASVDDDAFAHFSHGLGASDRALSLAAVALFMTGTVQGVVEVNDLAHTDTPCSSGTYRQGSAFISL